MWSTRLRFRSMHAAVPAVLFVAAALSAQSPPKMDNLVVYGKNFSFAVKEPDGWRADTEKIASQYHVNIIFLPSREESLQHKVSIRVRVNKKQDENTVEDLNYDLQEYRKQYPAAQVTDLKVEHPEYKTFASTVYLPKKFHEYVAYLNPGPGRPFVFSVAMSKQNEPATEEELNAYKSILKSVQWLTSPVIVK